MSRETIDYKELKKKIDDYKKQNPEATQSKIRKDLKVGMYAFDKARGIVYGPYGTKGRKPNNVRKGSIQKRRRQIGSYTKVDLTPTPYLPSIPNVVAFVVKGDPEQVARVLAELNR